MDTQNNESNSLKEREFYKELQILINRHSKESESNTPDWILAQYLINCLINFNVATQQRESWYGRDPRPSLSKKLSVENKDVKGVE